MNVLDYWSDLKGKNIASKSIVKKNDYDLQRN